MHPVNWKPSKVSLLSQAPDVAGTGGLGCGEEYDEGFSAVNTGSYIVPLSQALCASYQKLEVG